MPSSKTILIILICIGFSSCARLFLSSYGIHKPKGLSTEQEYKWVERMKLNEYPYYKLPSDYFNEVDSLNANEMRNHHLFRQPLQIRVFGPDDSLMAFYCNALASGFVNLDWNHYAFLDTLPVKGSHLFVDTVFTLDEELSYLNKVGGPEFQYKEESHTIVVYWAEVMGRQTKRMVRMVHRWKDKYFPPETRLIHVNCDALFLTPQIKSYEP